MIEGNGEVKVFVLYAVGVSPCGSPLAFPCSVSFWNRQRAEESVGRFLRKCKKHRMFNDLTMRIVIVETKVEIYGNEIEQRGD